MLFCVEYLGNYSMAKSTLGIAVCLLFIGACQIVADNPCSNGEEWKVCGHHLTCDNVLEYEKGDTCFPGCFCKGKTIRNKRGDCVPLNQCDKPREECPKNEVFIYCRKVCEPTCGKKDYSCICEPGHTRTCVCEHGYIRRSTGGECIPDDECPPEENYYQQRKKNFGPRIRRPEGPYMEWNGRDIRKEPQALIISGRNNTNDAAPTSSPAPPEESPKKNRKRRDTFGMFPHQVSLQWNPLKTKNWVPAIGYPKEDNPIENWLPAIDVSGGNSTNENWLPAIDVSGGNSTNDSAPTSSPGEPPKKNRKRRNIFDSPFRRYNPLHPSRNGVELIGWDRSASRKNNPGPQNGVGLIGDPAFRRNTPSPQNGVGLIGWDPLKKKNLLTGIGVSGGNNTTDSTPSSSPAPPEESPKKNRKRRDMQCPQNEIFSKCGGNPRCEDFCNNEKIIVCPQVCRSGCVCRKGYIRKTPRGMCIPENKCPVVHRCAANEIYASCGGNRKCEEYCNRKKPLTCPLVCYDGCTCREGYIRNVPGGICIPKNQCPKDSGSHPIRKRRDDSLEKLIRKVNCSEHEVFNECASLESCQNWCNRPRTSFSCGAACVIGCTCKEGYIRDVKGGTCIPEKQCPTDPNKLGKSDERIHIGPRWSGNAYGGLPAYMGRPDYKGRTVDVRPGEVLGL